MQRPYSHTQESLANIDQIGIILAPIRKLKIVKFFRLSNKFSIPIQKNNVTNNELVLMETKFPMLST